MKTRLVGMSAERHPTKCRRHKTFVDRKLTFCGWDGMRPHFILAVQFSKRNNNYNFAATRLVITAVPPKPHRLTARRQPAILKVSPGRRCSKQASQFS